ncbi:MAG TPA: bifunctional phosphopantothenoylcysteine decarboxylase/phosphopantothenate--cysteine ligase CoaBC [Chitinophagales bacterium]|jgi:phosphopantothenoylcysteine decarboxylase/phosphopantothenate--cysteine ligase|nr:bifunctional phosphopantothenoylcysteine decarboxylase/phosphopantothenate--cysteine ligase CoaBC [Chitinophagales bacterium]HQV77691.1 bifunctional phosphopantothenoylcysteine decarboxylase/phosphopantothenate--cysteine ligase CoaBC [Chitinophagales bacterium]HQW78164.1 bifunctional phosphopantothenoylcysteine decarboxylase/phosphopantothenate--cysteine ligase CoaBC [Chitinophagales bacterium]
MLKNKKIILAVCGSIAAYKAAFLVRLLVKEGAEVKVVMTQAATEFISPLTMATLSKNECHLDYINSTKTNWNNHVELALWADIMLIAPASANTLAKMANGLCDNLLLAVYLSARCPIFIAPAMDEDMWKHPSTKNNIEKLKLFGNTIISVNNGELASGLIGEGRMAEPQEMVDFILNEQKQNGQAKTKSSKLKGKKLLITAGPTYEAIDPVRFVGNHSSGKMGIALAQMAHELGADVQLVLGPSKLEVPNAIKVTRIFSANEMYDVCKKHFSKVDICIFAAAVADYTPKTVSNQKIKKDESEFSILLKKNVDIAYEFGKIKKSKQLSIGFALETNDELKHAKGKLAKKNFDIVVLNSLNDKGAGFQFNTNKITIVNKNNKITKFELKNKEEVANDILNEIEKLI